MKKLQNFINGKYVDAVSGKSTEVINPATGAAYATAPLSSAQDVDQATKAAANAFSEWRDSTPSERQKALLKIADAFEARADELVALESENTGKPIALTMSEEIPPMIDQIRFFAGAARLLEGRSAGEYMRGHTSMIRREPIGVVGQVTPWNYPMMMAIWKWAPAIAAGNTVVLKPSDTTPASTVWMAQILAEHLPAGVFNVVCGDRDTGRALVEHEIPQMVSITGSVRAGMEVAKSASTDLKKVHLELGGKAPLIATNVNAVMPYKITSQIELGTKIQLLNQMQLSAAIFQINKPYEYTTILDGAYDKYVQRGTQKHTGLELGLAGHLTNHLSIQSSAMAINAVTEGTGDQFDGKRAMNVSKFKASTFISYKLPNYEQTSLNGGWLYEGSKYAKRDNSVKVPEYHRFDAGLTQVIKANGTKTTISFYVENLLDKRYWRDVSEYLGDAYLIPGAPRIFRATAKLDF